MKAAPQHVLLHPITPWQREAALGGTLGCGVPAVGLGSLPELGFARSQPVSPRFGGTRVALCWFQGFGEGRAQHPAWGTRHRELPAPTERGSSSKGCSGKLLSPGMVTHSPKVTP